MNVGKLNDWLTLCANVGVLVGILFLIFELQQANRIATTTAEVEIRNQFGEINAALYSDEVLAEIVDRVSQGGTEFSSIETARYYQWVIQLVNIWITIETAYENGIAPEETYGVMFDTMNLTLSAPLGQDQLRIIYNQYPSLVETVVFQYIDEQLSQIGK